MTTTTTKPRSMFAAAVAPPAECENQDWYYIIGKAKGLSEVADNRADELIGQAFNERFIGELLYYAHAPDGLIVQRWDKCYVTHRGQLKEYDPNSPNWTNQRKEQPAHEPTVLEMQKWLGVEVKSYLEYLLRYRYGNRHLK